MICASNCYGDEMVYQEPEPYAIEFAINSIQENAKLKAEINRSNGKSEMYRDMADSFCNSNIKLKAEINQLKSELEQSVKLPCKVGDTIYETFDGKINDWVIERISDVVIELKEKEPFMDNRLVSFVSKSFGKFVFLTQEEAEQSLKGQV